MVYSTWRNFLSKEHFLHPLTDSKAPAPEAEWKWTAEKVGMIIPQLILGVLTLGVFFVFQLATAYAKAKRLNEGLKAENCNPKNETDPPAPPPKNLVEKAKTNVKGTIQAQQSSKANETSNQLKPAKSNKPAPPTAQKKGKEKIPLSKEQAGAKILNNLNSSPYGIENSPFLPEISREQVRNLWDSPFFEPIGLGPIPSNLFSHEINQPVNLLSFPVGNGPLKMEGNELELRIHESLAKALEQNLIEGFEHLQSSFFNRAISLYTYNCAEVNDQGAGCCYRVGQGILSSWGETIPFRTLYRRMRREPLIHDNVKMGFLEELGREWGIPSSLHSVNTPEAVVNYHDAQREPIQAEGQSHFQSMAEYLITHFEQGGLPVGVTTLKNAGGTGHTYTIVGVSKYQQGEDIRYLFHVHDPHFLFMPNSSGEYRQGAQRELALYSVALDGMTGLQIGHTAERPRRLPWSIPEFTSPKHFNFYETHAEFLIPTPKNS